MTRAFAGYAITETLSLGAEAILYRALRESDQRPVLIRALAAGEPSVRAAARLLHESELTGLLDLPTVVRAFVHDPSGDAPWIVLEDFGAITLERLLAGPMSVDEFLPWAIRAASALADVHARGVIHRDLCPRNLLLEPGSGTLKLTGFGLASRLEREQPSPGDPRLIAGTLAYISPEQTGRMNRTVDSRSDLYSLGVTFYYATGEGLVARLPSSGGTPTTLAKGYPWQMVADATHLYWAEQQSGGRAIVRAPKAGGVVEVVATVMSPLLGGLALDEYTVYWLDGPKVIRQRK